MRWGWAFHPRWPAEGSGTKGRRLIYTVRVAGLGKLLVIFGIVLVALGLLLVVIDSTGLPLGRLPGDIHYRGKNTALYFPLTTSILISVILSVVLYVISRLGK